MDEFTQDDLMRFFTKELYEALGEELAERDDADYNAVIPQAAKVMSAYYFCEQYVREHGGTIDKLKFSPKTEIGGFSVYTYLIDMYGEDLKKFCDLFSGASALTFEALTDGRVCMSCTFPGVFKKT